MGKWECQLQADGYYQKIKEEIGVEPTFEDLIKYRISTTSKEHVKTEFSFYSTGWNLIGKDTSNADAIYDKYFNTRDISEILKNVDNGKFQTEQLEEKNKINEELKFKDNLGIVIMSINTIYFILESGYRIFTNKEGVFNLWGYNDEVYKLSGILLLLSIFGLNYYYNKSQYLKQVIDDLWLIILKFKTFLFELIEIKTVQNIFLWVIGILFVAIIISYAIGAVFVLIEYWHIILISLISIFLFILIFHKKR